MIYAMRVYVCIFPHAVCIVCVINYVYMYAVNCVYISCILASLCTSCYFNRICICIYVIGRDVV